MAKEEQNIPLNFGDLGTIRNILMGQQMNQYEEQFEAIDASLRKLEAHFNKKLEALSEKSENARLNLQNESNNRFDQLEKALAENVKLLTQELHKVSREDKARLGEMLAEVSKQLMGGEKK